MSVEDVHLCRSLRCAAAALSLRTHGRDNRGLASTNGMALMNVDRAGRFAFNRTALRSPVYNQFEMCRKPAYGESSSCNKRPYGFGPKFPTFPRKDGEGAKNDAEKKVDEKKVDPTKKMLRPLRF